MLECMLYLHNCTQFYCYRCLYSTDTYKMNARKPQRVADAKNVSQGKCMMMRCSLPVYGLFTYHTANYELIMINTSRNSYTSTIQFAVCTLQSNK